MYTVIINSSKLRISFDTEGKEIAIELADKFEKFLKKNKFSKIKVSLYKNIYDEDLEE